MSKLPVKWSVSLVFQGLIFFQMFETKQRKPYIAPLANETGVIWLTGTLTDPPTIFSFHPPHSFCNDHRTSPMSPPWQSSRNRPKHYLTGDSSLIAGLPPLLLRLCPNLPTLSNPAPSSVGYSTYIDPKVSLYLGIVSFFLHPEPFMSSYIAGSLHNPPNTCCLWIINSNRKEERPGYQRSNVGDRTKKYGVNFSSQYGISESAYPKRCPCSWEICRTNLGPVPRATYKSPNSYMWNRKHR